MLKLRDFLHLPQMDTLVDQLVAEESGVIILAGIDARQPGGPAQESFKPSGLSALFNILMQEILLAHPGISAAIVTDNKTLARVPRQLSRRVGLVLVEPPLSYGHQIEMAMRERPGLLVIDHLTEETLAPTFRAAAKGLRVLTQLDSVLRGPMVARQLIEMGLSHAQLSALRWIFTSQRMSVLCDRCKQVIDLPKDLIEHMRVRFPHLNRALDALLSPLSGRPGEIGAQVFYRAGGCEHCRGTGYQGDISVFDLFRNDPAQQDFFSQPSLLSLEEYALHLASNGQLDLNDLLQLESDHLRRTYQMLTSSERALAETNSALSRKLLELEASNRVLIQRTEVLMSLQDLGQALISSTELNDLANRICRRAGDLCGAERVVLYLRRSLPEQGEAAEIIAERGWNSASIGQRLDSGLVFGQFAGPGISPAELQRSRRFMQPPPGFHLEPPSQDTAAPTIRMGLRVPLVVQNNLVGMMIIQSTQKDHFTQGETALLHTFANQAALAIQRAGLVDELRAKITQLEAAQAELVKKERLERELELARQVQQSMLPHSFPQVPGYRLSAQNEPARQVGGDFYDVILLDDDHFGVVVADVADKGLPAALYMALTRSLLLAEARRTLSPRLTLLNVNRLLLELGELNGFVSVFYGVVECSSRQITYTRAGHERPLLLRDHGAVPLEGTGAVLGVMGGHELNLSEEQVTLMQGDRLVLYTDGLTDVLDSSGHFSGADRLKDLLQTKAGLKASEICAAVFDELVKYRGSADQFDDMTLLVLEVD